MVNLINSKVYLTHPEIVQFLYPDFRYMEQIIFLPNIPGVIYPVSFGTKIEETEITLAQYFPQYIILCKQRISQVDQEFIDPEDYIELISGVRRIRYAQDVGKKCKRLEEEDLLLFFKMSIVLRRWYREMFQAHERMYSLFEAFTQPRTEFLQVYFSLLEHSPPEKILASVLTFLERTVLYKEQKDNLSAYYRRMVRRGKHQFVDYKKALMALLSTPEDIPNEVRFLNFYLALRGTA